jgi:hypothetical protein
VAYTNVNTSLTTKNGVAYDLQYDRNTGAVQIIQQNAAPGIKPVYQDGKWNSSAITAGFSVAEQNQLHQQTILSIQSAYNSIGGVNSGSKLPQWAAKNLTNGTPGQTSITPSSSVSGNQGGTSGGGLGTLAQAILNPNEALNNIAVNNGKYGLSNQSSLFGNSKYLTYPEDLMTNQQDHLTITMYSYKPPNQQALFNTKDATTIAGYGLQKNSNLESKIGTVFLPMPQSVSDNNAVSWGDDSMSNLAASVTANTLNNLPATGGTALAGALGGFAADAAGLGGLKTITDNILIAKNMIQMATSGNMTNEFSSLASADIASKLIKKQGYGVETESILARGAGVIPNSNLELLFNGPSLRGFSFTYRVSPRSAEEAKIVRRIIRFFKQGMAAKKVNGKAGQGAIFLGTPNVFKLEYRSGTKSIDGVNKFKTCALTAFSCNYTPEGIWAAYEAGQPVSTVFSMSFSELEPIYDTDYQEGNIFSGFEDDLSSISNDSVGY